MDAIINNLYFIARNNHMVISITKRILTASEEEFVFSPPLNKIGFLRENGRKMDIDTVIVSPAII